MNEKLSLLYRVSSKQQETEGGNEKWVDEYLRI